MRTIRSYTLATLLLIIGMLASACQSEPQAQATPAAPPAATAGAASLGATAEAPSGPQPIPTASPGKSVIHGIILSYNTKKPLTEAEGVDVFLAAIVDPANPDQRMVGLDKTTAPRADPDKNGVFVFADVPPGEYALAIRGPASEVLGRTVDDPGKDHVFTVTAGQMLDLGQMYATYP
jgi:hypothetical protein